VAVGLEHVSCDEKSSFDQFIGLLEIAVFVLDDDRSVIADPVKCGEDDTPVDVAQSGQSGDLPSDA
jgi:hypothetical protein